MRDRILPLLTIFEKIDFCTVERKITMVLLVICIVIIVGSILAIRMKKTETFCTVLGCALIGFHLLVSLKNYNTGSQVEYFTNVQSLSNFFWDLSGFLGYHFVLIIGIIFLVAGLRGEKAKDKAIILEEERITKEAQENGMTAFEYIQNEVPQEVLEACEEVRGYKGLLKVALDEYEKKGVISSVFAYILWQEYMRNDVDDEEDENEE
jgi:hypothetical protein